jgi:hypothetical protein
VIRRWRDRWLGRSEAARVEETRVEEADANPVVADALATATELQSLGGEIDAFRRKGGAALGGEPGPELEVLRNRQDEVIRGFLERALQVERGDPQALDDAHRRLGRTYADAHDLVTGRALELVEAALRRGER